MPKRITEKNARKLLKFLDENKSSLSPLLIVMHDYPDPDALSAAFALDYLAEKMFGIKSRIVYGGVIGRVENHAMVNLLKIPVHKIRTGDIKKHSNIALIDTQPSFENNSYPSNKRASMIIDQHVCEKKPLADFSIIDTDCGATSVILARALLLSGIEIPKKLATALTYGILSDTMNLYRARREDITQTYLDILPLCDMRLLVRIQNPAKSKKYFNTLNKALQNAKSFKSLLVSHLGKVEHPDLVSEMTDFLVTYQYATRAVCTGRYKSKLHISLRSTKVGDNAPEILRAAFLDRKKAGGHGTIAGGNIEISKKSPDSVWQETETNLILKIMKKLHIPAKGEFRNTFCQKNSK